MNAKATKARMGRPPLPPEKRRSASMGFRPTPSLRASLEAQAAVNQRSVSQEIEHRLERSFHDDARFAALMGEDGGEMAHLFGAAIRTASILGKTKRPYRDDPATVQQINRWENNKTRVAKWADRILRVIYREYEAGKRK